MRAWSSFMRLCLAALLALLPSVQQAHAQEGGGVPQEETVAELRQILEVLLAFDRQRAMFGLPSTGGAQAVTITESLQGSLSRRKAWAAHRSRRR
jgi:hypothetical protein